MRCSARASLLHGRRYRRGFRESQGTTIRKHYGNTSSRCGECQRSVFSGEVKFVALPGEVGELGILPGHTPLITRIRPGTVKIVHLDDTEERIFVAGGVLEVQPQQVTVLADTALRAEEIGRAHV